MVVTMVIQVRAVARLETGFFDSDLERVANIMCFFTIWSNLLVGATSAMLAVRLHRRSFVFGVLYLSAVLMIVVTFVVVIVALDPISQYEGKAAAADFLTHKLVPVMAVVGWLVFGPRNLAAPAVVRAWVAIPLAWVVFTLLRGPLASDYYPYPFVDVVDLGYGRVLINMILVAGLFFGLALAASRVDEALSRRTGHTATPPAKS